MPDGKSLAYIVHGFKRVKPGKSCSSTELKYEPFSPATPSLRVSESMLGLNGGVEVEEGLERTWKIQKKYLESTCKATPSLL